MPKELRMIMASDELAPIIDRGADVDRKIKDLTSKDSGLKKKIVDLTSGELDGSEKSIKVEGGHSRAVVTAAESVKLDLGAEDFPKVKMSVAKGYLGDAVTKKRTLCIPPDKIDEAATALKEAGIDASVVEEFFIDKKEYDKMLQSEVSSSEQADAQAALKHCVKTDTTYRVKYEKIEG